MDHNNQKISKQHTQKNLLQGVYEKLCSYENLELAFKKARRGKTRKQYVIEFENHLKENLSQLSKELSTQTYNPRPLKTFILRDPKTRKICKSHFRDRIVHHAVCNIIESAFEKQFIHDSYANRKGKGTLKALQRFDAFKRKVSKNNTIRCFVLKADVKHYFETVNHSILLNMLQCIIQDKELLWLIDTILVNYKTAMPGKGMPLGNLTSQFFANIYLNELDQYVKHELRVKYYIRYVDDFVIFHQSKNQLEIYKTEINKFLREKLDLELHPDKSQILKLNKGIGFLGFRVFYHHKLIRKKNIRKFERRFHEMYDCYKQKLIDREKVIEKFEGWLAYASHANTFNYRRRITSTFNQHFPIHAPVNHIKRQHKFGKKIEVSKLQFTQQKTLQLFKEQKLTIPEIAERRRIKESTVWSHIANLIEHHQLKLKDVLPKEKTKAIIKSIKSDSEPLKKIRHRIQNNTITYNEILCVLASIKARKKEHSIYELATWYQKVHCYRKCYHNTSQRKICKAKFDLLAGQNPKMKLKRKEFLGLFNNHLTICVLPEKDKLRYVRWDEFQTLKRKSNSEKS
ncbi:MAG: reverse transcriptase domain-containing protein [Candidatus Nanoarchaeia archaeon]